MNPLVCHAFSVPGTNQVQSFDFIRLYFFAETFLAKKADKNYKRTDNFYSLQAPSFDV